MRARPQGRWVVSGRGGAIRGGMGREMLVATRRRRAPEAHAVLGFSIVVFARRKVRAGREMLPATRRMTAPEGRAVLESSIVAFSRRKERAGWEMLVVTRRMRDPRGTRGASASSGVVLSEGRTEGKGGMRFLLRGIVDGFRGDWVLNEVSRWGPEVRVSGMGQEG